MLMILVTLQSNVNVLTFALASDYVTGLAGMSIF